MIAKATFVIDDEVANLGHETRSKLKKVVNGLHKVSKKIVLFAKYCKYNTGRKMVSDIPVEKISPKIFLFFFVTANIFRCIKTMHDKRECQKQPSQSKLERGVNFMALAVIHKLSTKAILYPPHK